MAMAIERDEEGKHCPVCGNFFYRKTEFCSDDCFFKFENRKKICPVCGKVFYARIKNTVYCSDICKNKKNLEYHTKLKERRDQARRNFLLLLSAVLKKKENAAQKKKPRRRRVVHEERICPVCGICFFPVRSTKVCCSSECAQKNFRVKGRKILKKVCPHCGKEFETTNRIKKFCSLDCGKRYLNLKQKKHKQTVRKKSAQIICSQALSVMKIMHQYRKECPVCGRGFYTVMGKEFCSERCKVLQTKIG